MLKQQAQALKQNTNRNSYSHLDKNFYVQSQNESKEVKELLQDIMSQMKAIIDMLTNLMTKIV